jgi:excisionase family DNA binding protein
MNNARVPRQAYRVSEFADALGLSDQSVSRAIKAGKIRTFRLNAMVLIPAEELDRVRSGTPRQTDPPEAA